MKKTPSWIADAFVQKTEKGKETKVLCPCSGAWLPRQRIDKVESMGKAVLKIYEGEKCNLSEFVIAPHALSQYMIKCKLGTSMVEAMQQMRIGLREVKRVELNKRERPGRKAYLDEQDIVYIVEGKTIITVFPNERIFVAKSACS